jgi:hypothetical protein
MGKEEGKLSLVEEIWSSTKKDPKNSMDKLLDLINTFNKVAEYKINIQKSIYQQWKDWERNQ